MDIGVYSINKISNTEVVNLLKERKSFVLEDISVTKFGKTVETVEKLIEELGMKCRIYTKGRKALIASTVLPNPVTIITGIASTIAIGSHNLATWNPDYEIGKNRTMGTLTISYKKKS